MLMYMIISQYFTSIMMYLSYTYCYARREIFNHGKYMENLIVHLTNIYLTSLCQALPLELSLNANTKQSKSSAVVFGGTGLCSGYYAQRVRLSLPAVYLT